jgi:hypothetical protein
MAVSLTHTTVAVGTNAGNGEVAKEQWNENHTLTAGADKLLGTTTAGAVVEIDCTAAGRALLDDADAAAQRTTLGLGTVAIENTVPVNKGGTGATTLTANNVLLGNGTSAPLTVAPGTSGNVLTSNGTTWQSTAPAAGGFTTAGDGLTGSGSTVSINTNNSLGVGAYTMAVVTTGSVTNGSTIAGSSLISAVMNQHDVEDEANTVRWGSGGVALSGTWRNVSGHSIASSNRGTGLFIRTA